MKPICYIFGAGEPFNASPELSPHDFVIAADGGYSYAKSCGVMPDLLIGDFDSLPNPPSGIDMIRLPKEKDDTDMSAAIKKGLRLGFQTFHIYGGTGGRFDHTLANIQCLAWLAGQNAQGFLFGRDDVITAICNCNMLFPENASGTVSVFSHTDTSTGVYERGLKYPLENATLTSICPLGVSNEFLGRKSEISVENGTLIIIYPACV